MRLAKGSKMTVHKYQDNKDLQDMQELLLKVRPKNYLDNFPGVDGLRELLELEHIQNNTSLWRKNGQLKSFGMVDKRYSNFYFELKEIKDKTLLKNMLSWAENTLKLAKPKAKTVDTSCLKDDTIRWQQLIDNGFEEETTKTIRLERKLDKTFESQELPDGFHIREFKRESELEAFVTLHRAAFSSDDMTIEERQSWLNNPEYDSELDLVIEAPDGSLAAYCFTHIDGLTGYTDPIATHPKYFRNGFARALITRAFQLLQERNIETAALTTSSENQIALKVYKGLGFEIVWSKSWFAKPLSQNGV